MVGLVQEADAAGLTDFYGLQALATHAMLEGGEALVRLRYRRTEDGLPVALQIQVLEAEHLPTTMNRDLPGGNVIRAGIEFDRLGRRVAYQDLWNMLQNYLLYNHLGKFGMTSNLT